MKKIMFLKMFFLTFFINSQNLQNNNWVHSNSVGLNFSTLGVNQFNVSGPTDYNTATYLEGCASVSDQNGNLLMFSNGVKVWCRNSSNTFVTVNGELQGDPSSTQNVIFIPKPGNPSKYFIVTISGNTNYLNNGTGFKGLFYSEIDTSNQIMTTPTALTFSDINGNNVPINLGFQNISESITSTKHSNDKDLWLVAHVQNEVYGGRLLSFKVTCSGIQSNLIMGSGLELTIQNENKATALKISPNSEKYALFSENSVYYGVFNNTTGFFSTPSVIENISSYNGEFSPDSNILFYNNSNILMAKNLINQVADIAIAQTTGFYGIQIARNNKIYFTGLSKGTNRIRVINNPNSFNNFNIQNTSFSHPYVGFPQTVHSSISSIIASNDNFSFNLCSNNSTNSQITSLGNIFQNDTFNGNLIATNNGYTINASSISPIVSTGGITLNNDGTVSILGGTPSGIYTLNYYICSSNCECSNLATVTISISTSSAIIPIFNSINPICQGDSVSALPTISNNGIVGTWVPSTINNITTSTYTFTPNPGQCATSSTMTVVVNPRVSPEFSQIGPICQGSLVGNLPTISNNGISGSWSPSTINNTTTSTYTFTPNPGQCAISATMTIVVNPKVTPEFSQIGPICQGSLVGNLPTISNNGISGSWSPSTINNTTTSTYTFTPNPGQCVLVSSIEMTIEVIPNITPTFNQIGPFCAGTQFTLPSISTNGISGTWSPQINNTATQTYIFTPNSIHCASSVSVTVTINNSLNNYIFSVSDQYIDGTQSGNNIVGLSINSNFPSSTTYEWNVYREDGTIDNYLPTTNKIRYVSTSFTNRIIYVDVIAHFNGCSRLITKSFRCGIPELDIYGTPFPDCDGTANKFMSREEINILVSPNPTTSNLNFTGKNLDQYKISIFNSNGVEIIKNKKLDHSINIEKYDAGIYFYVIYDENGKKLNGKIIKQ